MSHGHVVFVPLLGDLAQTRFLELMQELTDTAEELDQLSPYLPSNQARNARLFATQLCAMLAGSRWGHGSSKVVSRQAATGTTPRAESDNALTAAGGAVFAGAQTPRRCAGWTSCSNMPSVSPSLKERGALSERGLNADVGARHHPLVSRKSQPLVDASPNPGRAVAGRIRPRLCA